MVEAKTRITRRAALGLLASAAALRATPVGAADFAAFVQSLWPEAEAKGVRRATFDALVAGLTPDSSLPKSSGGQPEFDKPLQTYVREAVSAGRIARGQALAAQYADALASAEGRFGVPREICLAAWGLESDYGRSRGTRDIVRTLATLAYTRPDRPVFRDEFAAALVILDRGEVDRSRLVGSWAGAMGDPQFLPSAYLKYAVAAAGGAAAPTSGAIPPTSLPRSRAFCAPKAGRRTRHGSRMS